MVDFNNETTIGTPAVDIMRVLILQRRSDAIEAIEFYKKKQASGVIVDSSSIQSRLFSLFLEVEETLKRHLSEVDIKSLEDSLGSKNLDTLIDCFRKINTILDAIKLTRIDTGKVYDYGNIEEENKVKGL